MELGRNGAFYSTLSSFAAFTIFSSCIHDCTGLVICLEFLCLLCCCCCCYCCQRVDNPSLGVLRLTAGGGLQLQPAQCRSLALWHRHSTPCHSIRRLPAPGLELPPPGAFSSRRLSTHRRIGERWSDFGRRKDQHKHIQHIMYS